MTERTSLRLPCGTEEELILNLWIWCFIFQSFVGEKNILDSEQDEASIPS